MFRCVQIVKCQLTFLKPLWDHIWRRTLWLDPVTASLPLPPPPLARCHALIAPWLPFTSALIDHLTPYSPRSQLSYCNTVVFYILGNVHYIQIPCSHQHFTCPSFKRNAVKYTSLFTIVSTTCNTALVIQAYARTQDRSTRCPILSPHVYRQLLLGFYLVSCIVLPVACSLSSHIL